MNNKLKGLAVFALILLTTACAEDKYVSVRHPEDSNITEVTDSDLEENTTDPVSDQDLEEDNGEDGENLGENQGENASEETDQNIEEAENAGGVIYTVDGVVNVRLAPSESSNIITQAEPGQDIIKLGESDNWTRVSISGQTGYIRSDLIREK